MAKYLVYLEWPEKCFRADAGALAFLRTLVPAGSRIVRARDDAQFLKALPSATHVIAWHFKKEWFSLAPKLKLVATPAAGRELVSTEAPKGVTVHFGGFHGALVSETVMAFVLAWTHGFLQMRSMPLWPRSELAEVVDRDLRGSRAVVLGYGRIGRAIAARLASCGVSVFGYSRHLKIAKSVLVRELKRADWLIAALPSDTGTDNLVDAKLLSSLPARCVFVNVGRGNCVDERALFEALKAKRLAGAYLDVYRNEPTVLAKVKSKSEKVKSEDEEVKSKSEEVKSESEKVRSEDENSIDLAMMPEKECPWNLIRMPHAACYSPSYVKMAFKELKDEGLI